MRRFRSTRFIMASTIILTCLLPMMVDGSLNSPYYSLRLHLDPVRQWIGVSGYVDHVVGAGGGKEITFYLHRQLTVKTVNCPGLAGFAFLRDRRAPAGWMPEARPIVLTFSHPPTPGSRLRIEFAYSGKINQWPLWSASVIGGEWTELGVYFPWFPYNPGHGVFTFELRVLCDQSYRVIGNGSVTHEKNGWKISTRYPVKDMVVVASKNLKSLEVVQARLPVVVQYQAITDLTAREIADEVSALVQLYEGWFGGDRKTGVTILQSMREKGGGYARRGFISLGGLSDEKYRSNHAGYLRYFAHEISHLWWNMAPSDSWEDWLNEGFAEYSALLVVKRRLGEEAFIERLQMKKQRASGAFPIRGFERGDNSTPEKRAAIENTLYHKAPLLLHRLHQRLGDKRFYSLCRSMVAGGISNTADFIRILETVSDVKTSAWFNTLLGE